MWNSACLSWQPPFWRSAPYACVSRPCALSPCAARQRALRPYALRPYASRQRASRPCASRQPRFAALRFVRPCAFPRASRSLSVTMHRTGSVAMRNGRPRPIHWRLSPAGVTAKATIREAAVRERIIRGFLDPLSRARAGLWHALFSSTRADSGHAGGPFNWTFVRPRSRSVLSALPDSSVRLTRLLRQRGHLRRLRTVCHRELRRLLIATSRFRQGRHLRASG